jgi:hypothetical protein
MHSSYVFTFSVVDVTSGPTPEGCTSDVTVNTVNAQPSIIEFYPLVYLLYTLVEITYSGLQSVFVQKHAAACFTAGTITCSHLKKGSHHLPRLLPRPLSSSPSPCHLSTSRQHLAHFALRACPGGSAAHSCLCWTVYRRGISDDMG